MTPETMARSRIVQYRLLVWITSGSSLNKESPHAKHRLPNLRSGCFSKADLKSDVLGGIRAANR
jgi:hypothetical protein